MSLVRAAFPRANWPRPRPPVGRKEGGPPGQDRLAELLGDPDTTRQPMVGELHVPRPAGGQEQRHPRVERKHAIPQLPRHAVELSGDGGSLTLDGRAPGREPQGRQRSSKKTANPPPPTYVYSASARL